MLILHKQPKLIKTRFLWRLDWGGIAIYACTISETKRIRSHIRWRCRTGVAPILDLQAHCQHERKS